MSETRNLVTWVREYLRINKPARWIVIALASITLFFLARCAFAQTAPTVTLTVTPATGISPVTPTATWSSTNASTCTASGAWAGTKATSGTETLPAIQNNASYTLTCTGVATSTTGTITVSWMPPTANTDGTPLTNLDGYDLLYGTSSNSLDQKIDVTNSKATSYIVDNLLIPDAGVTYFIGMKAYNLNGIRSELSDIASKVFPPTGPVPTAVKTATVTVNKKPGIPTLLVVSSTAMSVKVKWTNGRVAFVLDKEIGTVPIGTVCRRDFRIAKTDYFRVDRRYVDLTSPTRTVLIVANCSSKPIAG
jgi:hypothetical protein